MNRETQPAAHKKPQKTSTPAASPQKPMARTIVCKNPATGELLGEVPAMDAIEVKIRLERARQAQVSWGATSFAQRRRVLKRLLDCVLEHADEICRNIALESGKTLQNAMMGEIWPVCEKLRWTLENGERHLSPEPVSSGLLVHKAASIEYHPMGVIGVICPWNFPFQNIMGPTIPALMAGNAVLCKVSEWSSYSAPIVQGYFDEVLREAGQSPDLVQILTGYGETGAALVRSGVDKLFFTGSVGNGRRVVEGSVENLTPVVLELGGKDPLIVCDDAELNQAVAGAMAGVFISSGQMCLAAERIYVFPAIYDRFVAAVEKEVRSLRQGPPLAGTGSDVDVGAMTMPQQPAIVDRLVQDALQKGARALVGGKLPQDESGAGQGQFYPPTLLVDVDHSMALMREETFGPVMAVMRVQDEDDVVRLSNDCGFGLGSTVFSKDHQRAERIARRLRTGASCINDYGLAYMANDLPFGGVGQSGFGRLQGREGLRACTNIKAVMTDRFPLHIPSRIYPVRPGDYELVKAAVDLIYRPLNWAGMKARASAVASLVKHTAARFGSSS